MKYLKNEDKLDVNIDIRNTRNLIDQIFSEIQGLKNKSVLLYSELFTVEEIKESINKEWTPFFYDYLINNNVRIKNIMTFLPERKLTAEKRIIESISR